MSTLEVTPKGGFQVRSMFSIGDCVIPNRVSISRLEILRERADEREARKIDTIVSNIGEINSELLEMMGEMGRRWGQPQPPLGEPKDTADLDRRTKTESLIVFTWGPLLNCQRHLERAKGTMRNLRARARKEKQADEVRNLENEMDRLTQIGKELRSKEKAIRELALENQSTTSESVNNVSTEISEIPSEKELYDCIVEYESHKSLLADGNPLAVNFQRILESCYPRDPDRQFDLWCALVMDLGQDRDFLPIGDIMKAFKRWRVEEAYDCVELKDLFLEPEVRRVKVEEPKGAENTFNGISKESYYLTFNKDEIFKNLIASEGHFRNFTNLKEDKKGFLNCIVKHLADAESHADEAVSHALIAEDAKTSRSFLELRDAIRDFRWYIQSSPVTRDEGIREIRKLRRRFEGFNVDYDVSKCETCGDPAEVMEDITKILSDLKKTPLEVAAHEPEADEFLLMERDIAEKLIATLSEKYGVEPPKIEITEKCHEPSIATYCEGKIYMCRSGVSLHVLAHEFWHHVQKERGMHVDEGEAEKFAVDLFASPPEKALYANHNHSHTDSKMVKTIKDVGIIYGLQQVGFGANYILKWADTQMPAGLLGQPISLWGDLLGAIGGVLGALYLKAPYDLVMAIVGGYMSTDLWNQLIRLMPPTLVARPPTLVYTPPGTTIVKPSPVVTPTLVAPIGRYQITA